MGSRIEGKRDKSQLAGCNYWRSRPGWLDVRKKED